MEGASHLRRPTSGPFADRRPSNGFSAGENSSSSSVSRNKVLSNRSSGNRSNAESFSNDASSRNEDFVHGISNLEKRNSGTLKELSSTEPNRRQSLPPNKISSTLSKFEQNDALTQNSLLKSVPRRPGTENNPGTTIPGNKFLNGKTLRSVSNNRFSMGSVASKVGLGDRITPSSIASKSGNMQGRAFVNNALKNSSKNSGPNSDAARRVLKQEEKQQLLKKLTPTQFRVTQEKITERPYSNAYYKHWERGVYACVVCGQELFQSQTKYDSGSGWPAFYDIISWDRVTLKQDLSHVGANLLLLVCNPSLARTEVSCATCGSHIGHVFDDGPKPTGQRFCVNSASLSFSSTEEEVSRGGANELDQQPRYDDTLAPLVHMASPSNSCSLGARLCFRVPANIDGCDSPASRT